MKVFTDTSALYAFLDADNAAHNATVAAWKKLGKDSVFVTTNYVLLETFALLENRLGSAAVREFTQNIVPLFQVEWIDGEAHDGAVSVLLAAGRRELSLVDCVSFAIMRQRGIQCAFTLDDHFREQGFECLP